MTTVTKRLLKELQEVNRDTNENIISLGPIDDENILEWRAVIKGPEDTGYKGGKFEIFISVPEQYPIKPPTLTFATPVCHPNVHFETGEICLDILKTQWSPAWTLKSTCLAVVLLLSNPEPSSPLNCDAANILRCGDTLAYHSLVSFYTRLYAM